MFARFYGVTSIAPGDLHELIQRHEVVVIDVNSPQSWSAARVPGARHLDPAQFDASDLPDSKDAHIVFYCSNFLCRKAPTAARHATSLGYTRVQVMSAGIKGWIEASLPTCAGPKGPAYVAGVPGLKARPT